VASDLFYGHEKLPREPFLVAALFFVVVLHLLVGVSQTRANFTLLSLIAIISGALSYGKIAPSDHAGILKQLPRDIRTVVTRFEIEPDIIPYASCPKCSATYHPDFTTDVPYPNRCNFRGTPGDEICGATLVKPRQTSEEKVLGDESELSGPGQPIKLFGYQRMTSWLARLLSRPDLEDCITSAWDLHKSHDELWTDIRDAPALRKIKCPDGKPFSIQPPGSVHLVFSLFIDWFNPYGNKQAGKSHSTGAIYMICLNLPPELRFKLENVYLVGVIPGPKEPSLDEINHFLRPLVDDLLQLWNTGVFISRTFKCPFGCLVRCVLGPLVCDIPALRKAGGFAGHSSVDAFCSFCRLSKTNISNLDKSSWPRRTWQQHFYDATLWRDAQTEAE